MRRARAEPEIGGCAWIGIGSRHMKVHRFVLSCADPLRDRVAFERGDVHGDANSLQLLAHHRDAALKTRTSGLSDHREAYRATAPGFRLNQKVSASPMPTSLIFTRPSSAARFTVAYASAAISV